MRPTLPSRIKGEALRTHLFLMAVGPAPEQGKPGLAIHLADVHPLERGLQRVIHHGLADQGQKIGHGDALAGALPRVRGSIERATAGGLVCADTSGEYRYRGRRCRPGHASGRATVARLCLCSDHEHYTISSCFRQEDVTDWYTLWGGAT